MNISGSEAIATDVAGTFKGEARLGGGREIRGTPYEPRMMLGNRV